MIRKFLALMATFVLFSCSSTVEEKVPEDKTHEHIRKDYYVTDTSSASRPGWISNPEGWAKSRGKNVKKFRFFSFETDPKSSRSIACQIAKANVRADIAAEITTFIDKSLGSSQEGNADIDENNPIPTGVRNYIENTLVEKVQSLVHGAAVVQTYWEKRRYKKDLGAVKDFTAFTCAAFVRMSSERLSNAVEKAANFVASSIEDKSVKSKVENALKNANENFIKSRQGKQ